MKAWVLLSVILVGIVFSFSSIPSLGKNYLSIAPIPLTLQLNGGEENLVILAKELLPVFTTYTYDEEHSIFETEYFSLDFSRVSFHYSGYFQFAVPITNKMTKHTEIQYISMFIMDSIPPKLLDKEELYVWNLEVSFDLLEQFKVVDNSDSSYIKTLSTLDYHSTEVQILQIEIMDYAGNKTKEELHIQLENSTTEKFAVERNPWLENDSQELELQNPSLYQSAIMILKDYINTERIHYNLEPFEIEPDLYHAAMERAEETHRKRAHTRLNGKSFQTILDEYRIPYDQGYEIIFCNAKIPHNVHKKLFQNIDITTALLNDNYTRLGIGYYEGTWVLLLLNDY